MGERCSPEEAHVIEVERIDGHRQRQRLLGVLNRMGEAIKLAPRGVTTAGVFPVGADMLLKALLHLPTEDLLRTTLVNTFWFHATQRLSLMQQLRHGDLAFACAPPQEYTAWLSSGFGHSQQLALAEAQNRHRELEVWQSLNMPKEKTRKVYAFTKAAGCTQMKTVSLSGLSAEFEEQWLSLHSCKSKFMAECKAYAKELSEGRTDKIRTPIARINGLDACTEIAQALPSPGTQSFAAEAIDPKLRAVAVEMFRRYFSPDMYFIFPLIVGRETAFGLDFRSTTTTLFFGPYGGKDAPKPAGACSWRFRRPVIMESKMHAPPEFQQPLPFLEVLFIAVWEEERDQVHGGTLVHELEAQARAAGVNLLYVEIGFEQPKARRFWRKQGFGKAIRLEESETEKQALAEVKEEEDVPMPLIPLSDTQFAFFESNCLRFCDTCQYVKLLACDS